MIDPNVQVVETPQPPKKSSKTLIIILIVLAVLLFCCCAAAASLVLLDPFDLDLIGRLTGKTDLAAKAMPVDTPMYLGINLANFSPDKVNETIRPFMEASGQFDQNDSGDLIDELDQSLSETAGMTITDDVIPWIGQYIGIGYFNPMSSTLTGDLAETQIVVSVEARDKTKADEFIQKLIRSFQEEDSTYSVTEQAYEGVTIYALNDGYQSFAICRSGSLVLFGTPEMNVQNAIDAQKGENLRQSNSFKKMVAQLPGTQGISVYFDGEQVRNLLNTAMSGYGIPSMQGIAQSPMESWQDSIIALSLVDAGVQMDVVSSYDPERLSDADIQMMSGKGGIPASVSRLPEDTIMYIASKQLNLLWQTYRGAVITATGSDADYVEMMNLLEQQIGFDLEEDLVAYLDQDWTIAVVPDYNEIMIQLADLPVGVMGVFGTSNQQALQQTLTDFNAFLGTSGLSVNTQEENQYTLYEIGDPTTGSSVAAYGIGNDYLGISTSRDTLVNFFQGNSTLGDVEEHTKVWQAFDDNVIPSMYMDVSAGFELLRTVEGEYYASDFAEIAPYMEIIPYIAMGSTPYRDGVVKNTLIIFIDKE